MDKKEFLDEVIDAIVGIEYSMENEEYVEAGFNLGKLYQMCLTERNAIKEDVATPLSISRKPLATPCTAPNTIPTTTYPNGITCVDPAESKVTFPQTPEPTNKSTHPYVSDHTAYVPEHIELVGTSTNVVVTDVPTTATITFPADVSKVPAMDPPVHPDKPSDKAVENVPVCDNAPKDDKEYPSLDEMPTETLVERLKELPPEVLAKVEELAKKMSNRWEKFRMKIKQRRMEKDDDEY